MSHNVTDLCTVNVSGRESFPLRTRKKKKRGYLSTKAFAEGEIE